MKQRTLGKVSDKVWQKLDEIRIAKGMRYLTDVVVDWIEKDYKKIKK